MAVKISLGRVHTAKGGHLIVSGHDLFTVGIVYLHLFRMGIAGIAHCKMRSHLLRDQDRHPGFHAQTLCRHISRSVCADGKFSQRQCLMAEQDIFLNECLVLFLRGKISTVVVFNPAIFEDDLQILIFQAVQEHFCHMQHTVCAFQHRRGKYFSHGNIHVCHAVFKNSFFGRIFELPQIHCDIRVITVTALHLTVVCLIQRIDDGLLDPLIFFIIQGVDPNSLPEKFFKAVPYLRDGERNNRKATLFLNNILSLQLSHLGAVLHHKSALLIRHFHRFRLVHRCEIFLTEGLHHGRARIASGLCLIFFKSGMHDFQFPAAIHFIQEQCFVILVIELILSVGADTVEAVFINGGII